MAGGRIKFTLDTELNKAGINQLKQELQNLKSLTSQQMVDLGLSKDLEKAKKDLSDIRTSATQVEAALNKSFSASLGTTNLSKFNQELKSMNLAQIQQNLHKAGAAGQLAFRNLTTEVLTTKMQLKETNTWLTKMSDTMANTIRWGIASSAMNSLAGSAQKAWSYVKNLDKALNDIRIVSNASAEQMEKFAVQANRAARALGTSTKSYADAALIYYQQGLSEEEVQRRTDITMRMANVTGESAKQVSDYMTAIWNNFNDGGKSLDYYADVITALGAATASSADEIAGGLEKFAAVADTVGLSYEYATSALATITAETRQSEEVVGTALKTIFARIQGLELGETLEDGTTLNKYSQALADVGINIKGQNGELKDMDVILQELGQKWETLNKDQQVALAQTVAGVRQYNQLVALMDKWDVFQNNLIIAQNAEGETLSQQAIYMDSIEAHLEQVGASAERVYNTLADKDVINGLLEALDYLTLGVANTIEGLGGLQGILLKLGSVGSNIFGQKIAKGLAITITNMRKADKDAEQLNAQFEILKQFKDLKIGDAQFSTLVKMKESVLALQNTLTAEQQVEANNAIERQNFLQNEITLWEEKVQKAKNYYQLMTEQEFQTNGNILSMDDQKKALQEASDKYARSYKEVIKDLNSAIKVDRNGALIKDQGVVQEYQASAADLIEKATRQDIQSVEKLTQAYQKLETVLKSSVERINEDTDEVFLDEMGRDALQDFINAYSITAKEIIEKTKETSDIIDDIANKTGENLDEQAEENLNNFKNKVKQWDLQDTIQETIQLSGNVLDFASALSSVYTIPDIWADQDLSTGEKLLQTLVAVGNALHGLSSAAKIVDSVMGLATKAFAGSTAGAAAEVVAVNKTTQAHQKKLPVLKSISIAHSVSTDIIKDNEDLQQEEIQQTIDALKNKGLAANGQDIEVSLKGTVKSAQESAAMGVYKKHPEMFQNAKSIVTQETLDYYAKNDQLKTEQDLDQRELINMAVQKTFLEDVGPAVKVAQKEYAAFFGKAFESKKEKAGLFDAEIRSNPSSKDIIMTYNPFIKDIMPIVPHLDVNAAAKATPSFGSAFASYGRENTPEDIAAYMAAAKADNIVQNIYVSDSRDVFEPNQNNPIPGGGTATQTTTTMTSALSDILGQNQEIQQNLTESVQNLDDNFENVGTKLNTSLTKMTKTQFGAKSKWQSRLNKRDQENISNLPYQVGSTVTYKNAQSILYEPTASESAMKLINNSNAFNGVKTQQEEEAQQPIKETSGIVGKLKDILGKTKAALTSTIGVLMVFELAIQGMVAHYENYKRKLISSNNEIIKSEKEKQEEFNKNIAVINTYQDTYKQFKNGAASYEELKTAATQAADSINSNAASVALLTRNYAQLNEEMKKAKILELQRLNESTDAELMAAYSNASLQGNVTDTYSGLFDALGGGLGGIFGGAVNLIASGGLNTYTGAEAKMTNTLNSTQKGMFGFAIDAGATTDDEIDVYDILNKHLDTELDEDTYAVDLWKETKSIDDQYKYFQKLQAARNEILEDLGAEEAVKSEVYNALNDFVNNNAESMAQVKEALLKKQQAEFDLFMAELDVETYDTEAEVESLVDTIVDKLKGMEQYANVDEEELETIAENYVAGLSDIANTIIQNAKIKEEGRDRVKNEVVETGKKSTKELISDRIDGILSGETPGEGENQSLWEDIKDNYERSRRKKVFMKEYDKASETLTAEQNAVFAENPNLINEIDFARTLTDENYTFADAMREVADKALASKNALGELTEAQKKHLQANGVDSEEVEAYTQLLAEQHPELKKNTTALRNIAIANKRAEKGVEILSGNWEEYNEIMTDSKSSLEDVSSIMPEVNGAVKNLLNLTDEEFEMLPPDFAQKNWKLINDVVNGVEGSLDDLREQAGQEMLLRFTGTDKLSEDLQNLQNEIIAADELKFKVGVAIDDKDFIAKCQNLITSAKMTSEQAQAYFKAMGYDVELEEGETVTTRTEQYAVPRRNLLGWVTGIDVETVELTNTTPSVAIKTITPNGSYGGNTIVNTNGGVGNKNKNKGSSKKKKDPQKDELDRYQKVNSQLDKIGNTLDKLQDKRDKLTGQDLFDNLFNQFDTLNDKIDVTKDKLAIAIDEMNEYKQELAKDYGIKFGEDGIIQNYKEQYYKELNRYNAAINKYSASNKDSDQEKLKKAEERYSNYTDLIEKYDELIGSFIPGLEKDIRDSIDTQTEIKIDTFKYELELKLNIKDAKLEWNEFKKTVLDGIEETDILGNTKAKLADVKVYFDDMGEGLLQTNTEKINSLLTDLKNMDKGLDGQIYKDDRVSAMEDLKEYYTTLMDNLTEIHELSEEIHDSYMEMMDEAQEKFNEQIEAYSAINSLIEHDKNVITMIYGQESYSALSQFYNRQEENNNKQLDFQKQQVEFWANQMALTEEGSEEWDKAKENWMSAVSEWNSAVEAAIQNLQDKYLNAINEIFQKLNNEVTNGLGLDYVETQWDLVNRNAEEYLDSVNAIYNVQQLQSKYLDAIEQHDSTIQQKKLNDLMEQEIGYLREQDKLSQYDIDRANLKYEIALKQIALEEAQQNKTQLRLRRDSQGNYTYQYTQDDDQVSSIQQEIADLYNQLYNLDAEEYRGNLEGLYDVWVEFQERMAEAAQINDPEQRAAKELLIKEQYGELINTLTEKNELIQSNLNQSTMSHLFDLYNQNIENYDMMTAEQQAILSQFMTEETDFTNAAFDNLFGLYNTTVENFQGMSNAQRDILMGSVVPQWETAIQAMADKIIGEGGFFPVCSEAFTKLDETTQEYETGLATLQEVAGQSAEAIKNGLDPVIEKTQQLVKDNDELIETYNKELEAVQSIIDELDTLRQAYVDAESAAKTATEAAKNYWIAATNKDANADASKVLNAEFGTETDVTKDLAKTDTNNNTPAEPAKPTLEIGSFVDVKSGALWYSNSYGGGKSGRAKDGKIKYINSKGSHPYNIGGAGWIKKSDIVGYDTGGYTGDWGSDGRLAMLHQKELVLNASDTKNMLNAIEIVRDITSNLGATLMSRMAGISAASAYGGDSGVLEQNVHITAEFPNVENSHEIEDALNNLINKASQYIQK